MLTAHIKNNYLIAKLAVPERNSKLRDTLRLAILLDISDSMRGDRLTSVKRTLAAVKPLLNPTDRLTIVTFGTAAEVLVAHQPPTDHMFDLVDTLETAGNTNLQAGLEKLAEVARTGPAWDAVFLLTDGIVNLGITTTAGLQVMAQNIPTRWGAWYCLGYGGKHNRTLLRRLSVQTHGSYVYVADEELLPAAMGTIISGLRAETIGAVRISVQPADEWVCQEVGFNGSFYELGAVQGERDYWCVWRRAPTTETQEQEQTTTLSWCGALDGGGIGGTALVNQTEPPSEESLVQIWRCKAATVLAAASDALEADGFLPLPPCVEEFATSLNAVESSHPLILRIKGQIADIQEMATKRAAQPAPGPSPWGRSRGGDGDNDNLLATSSSGAAMLSTQHASVGDPGDYYATPLQREASQTTQETYVRTA
jgi:hypothetical protein